MKKISVILFLVGYVGLSQSTTAFFNQAETFFKTYVNEGKVDYASIHKNQEPLNSILKLAESVSVSKQNAKTYQAFWINAYNLSVIKGIIDNYPTKSPLDHHGFFDKTTYNLAGQQITLNAIEHELLRAKFNDARFHFVLVCGAIGCPPLISKAYLPKTLDMQMDAQTKLAINGNFLRVNTKKKRVEASQIMEWYKGDFTTEGKSEIDFINQYRTEKIPEKFKLSYFPYNWNINKQ